MSTATIKSSSFRSIKNSFLTFRLSRPRFSPRKLIRTFHYLLYELAFWPTVGNECRNGIQLCILSSSDCPNEELHLCCRSKKAWWILLPHAADLWNSECSLVCVFCLLCTWLIPRAVMASKWSVFNKQTWWTLPTCFMKWNSLVWTLARVEIPLTVWCWTAAFQLCYYPTIKHAVIKIAV